MADISATGVATSADGAVTVEVGLGGSLRAVRLSRDALSHGADRLSRTILDASRRATARANHSAREQFRLRIGSDADSALTQLGLDYDPDLLHDRDEDDSVRWRR